VTYDKEHVIVPNTGWGDLCLERPIWRRGLWEPEQTGILAFVKDTELRQQKSLSVAGDRGPC